MNTKPQTPKVGVAVIIRNKQRQVLMGLRKGSHGEGLWSLPGGHMELGESFLQTCKREVHEEVGLQITNIKQITFTNCIFKKEGLHYVTLFFNAVWNQTDTPEIREPDKMEKMEWVYPVNISKMKIMPGLRTALHTIFPELQKMK
jgi:8-oxo-dGTP diphosphatase